MPSFYASNPSVTAEYDQLVYGQQTFVQLAPEVRRHSAPIVAPSQQRKHYPLSLADQDFLRQMLRDLHIGSPIQKISVPRGILKQSALRTANCHGGVEQIKTFASDDIESSSSSSLGSDETGEPVYLPIISHSTSSTIYAIPEKPGQVLKVGYLENIHRERTVIPLVRAGLAKVRQILYDYVAATPSMRHKKRRIPTVPLVPTLYEFISKDDRTWDDYAGRMVPESDSIRQAQGGLIMSRIQPFRYGLRKQVVNKYFEDECKEEVLSDPKNEHFVVRPYLGRNSSITTSLDDIDTAAALSPHLYTEEQSLRNFPGHLNQLVNHLSSYHLNSVVWQVACAYAVLHWECANDARGVEFLLGMAPHGKAALFVIDFEETSEFEFTENEVKKKCVPAAHGNEPYIPRPNIDPDVWAFFADTYLAVSVNLLNTQRYKPSQRKIFQLPRIFIDSLKQAFEEEVEYEMHAEDYIVFEDEGHHDQTMPDKSNDEDRDEDQDEEEDDEDENESENDREEGKGASSQHATTPYDFMASACGATPNSVSFSLPIRPHSSVPEKDIDSETP